MRLLCSFAYLFFKTINLDPAIIVAPSRSIDDEILPISTWSLGVKLNLGILPHFLSSLFCDSSSPSGTSSSGRLGISSKKSSMCSRMETNSPDSFFIDLVVKAASFSRCLVSFFSPLRIPICFERLFKED